MAKVTWKGWREEPEEDCQVAYEFLTGRRTKPFVVVFGIPKRPKNHHGEETDDQDDSLAELRQVNTNTESDIELDDDDIEVDETADAAMLGVSDEDAREEEEEEEEESENEDEEEAEDDY